MLHASLLLFFCAHPHTWKFSGPLLHRSTEYINVCIYAPCSFRNTGSIGWSGNYKSDEENTHECLAALRDAFLQRKGYVEKLVEIRIFHVSHLTWLFLSVIFSSHCASLKNFRFYFKKTLTSHKIALCVKYFTKYEYFLSLNIT